MHTVEHRLIWLYTWPQQARKGKNQKNTVHMHHSCTLSGRKQPEKLIHQHLFPLSITDGEGEEADKQDTGYLYKGPRQVRQT